MKKIRSFYTRTDISRVVPQRRYATKDGPGHLLLISVKEAYNKYKKENAQETVCFSTFASLRPRNVRLLNKTHREYCMCGYCLNVRNKLLSLEHAKKSYGPKSVNEANLLEMLLCPKPSSQKFFAPQCIEGKCSKCSDYSKTLEERYNDIPEDKELTWNRWERFEGKAVLVAKTGRKHELILELVETDILHPAQGTTFFKHLHTAQWQQTQFSLIKDNLPENWILQVMDFAKNRGINYQEEIKAAFFANSQITMHPIVNYYQKGDGLVKDVCIILSEDLCHDYHAVDFYKSLVDNHIKDQLNAAPLKQVIFSDGCSAQYKSKGPFADLSLKEIQISRNFFGSEHGKKCM